MYVRLAFAVAAHLDSDILVLDEVLAVGDAEFQKKCLGKMDDVATKQGRTVLFVSHNLQAVSSLCKQSIFLENCKINFYGNTLDTIDRYLGNSRNNGNTKMEWINISISNDFSEILKISKYFIEDQNGNIADGILYNSKKYKIVIDVDIFKKERNLSFFISYYTEDDTLLFISDIHDNGDGNLKKLTLGKKRIFSEVPNDFFSNRKYKVELSCVIHFKGWPLIPNERNRLNFYFLNDISKNKIGYDESNHPFTGAAKPGLLNPIIRWDVIDC